MTKYCPYWHSSQEQSQFAISKNSFDKYFPMLQHLHDYSAWNNQSRYHQRREINVELSNFRRNYLNYTFHNNLILFFCPFFFFYRTCLHEYNFNYIQFIHIDEHQEFKVFDMVIKVWFSLVNVSRNIILCFNGFIREPALTENTYITCIIAMQTCHSMSFYMI